jgi:hypothetical protein
VRNLQRVGRPQLIQQSGELADLGTIRRMCGRSADVRILMHVNNRDGYTIVVSGNRQPARIARTTFMSDNAFSVMVPRVARNRLTLEAWDRARTDRVQIGDGREPVPAT